MYTKLSFRNGKRSVKDYLIFFVTLIVSSTLMYSFNALSYLDEIRALSDTFKFFSFIMIFVSFIMALVMAFLIAYVSKFIMNKRKREFGIYLTLGMEQKSVAFMFLVESILMGILALIIGIFLGLYVTQVFSTIITSIFDIKATIHFTFSIEAALITLLLFSVTYIVTTILNTRSLYKINLYDMLNDHKKNEVIKSKKSNVYILLFTLSIIAIAIGYVYIDNLLNAQSNSELLINGLLALGGIILGSYGVYYTFSASIVLIKNTFKRFKYKDTNLFLINQITSKVNSNGLLMGTLSFLLFMTLVSFLIGFTLSEGYKMMAKSDAPYDIMVTSTLPNVDYKDLYTFVDDSPYKIKDYADIKLYKLDVDVINNNQSNLIKDPSGKDYIAAIKYSDYSKLREILGLTKVVLKDDEFIVHSDQLQMKADVDKYLALQPTITINEESVTSSKSQFYNEPIGQIGEFVGNWIAFVLPDSLCNDLEVVRSSYLASTEKKTKEKFYDELHEFLYPWFMKNYGKEKYEESSGNIWRMYTKTKVENRSYAGAALFAFIALYLGVVFLIISCTILALQQLTDSNTYKYRFDLLRKLGTENKEINKLILKQVGIYFTIPLILPVIHTIVFAKIAGDKFSAYLPKENLVGTNILITLGIFCFVYTGYFIATFVQFKNNVNSHFK